jgi:hypothetical protein
LSFDATPGDYFSTNPGDGSVFTLGCERRFPVCQATSHPVTGCECRNGEGQVEKCSAKKLADKDCFCRPSSLDGVLHIDEVASSGDVTVSYVRFFKGYTHTMADTYLTHSPETFKATAKQCKKPELLECDPGQYVRPGWQSCGNCPAGTFSDGSTGKCTVCNEGQSTDPAGKASECRSCPAGQSTVTQKERKAPNATETVCGLSHMCRKTIAYIVGVYQFLDKGQEGCATYFARATARAIENGACRQGETGNADFLGLSVPDFSTADAGWGRSDSAHPEAHAWKSPYVRACWSDIETDYKEFRKETAWDAMCDIQQADPLKCGLSDRCLNTIGGLFKQNERLQPDYHAPAQDAEADKELPKFLKLMEQSKPVFATCPMFWEKQLSDASVMTSEEWEQSAVTGEWQYIRYDICPEVTPPVWRHDVYRRCWNAIRFLPFQYNGASFTTPACNPTNECHPTEPWLEFNPNLSGEGNCLDVDANGQTDAFDIMAIYVAPRLDGFGASHWLSDAIAAPVLSNSAKKTSGAARSPADVATAVDKCKHSAQIGTGYHVSNLSNGTKTATSLDAKLLLAYVSTVGMSNRMPVFTALMEQILRSEEISNPKDEASVVADRIYQLTEHTPLILKSKRIDGTTLYTAAVDVKPADDSDDSAADKAP